MQWGWDVPANKQQLWAKPYGVRGLLPSLPWGLARAGTWTWLGKASEEGQERVLPAWAYSYETVGPVLRAAEVLFYLRWWGAGDK